MITRRGLFLGALAAPAVVRAESLMKLWVPRTELIRYKHEVIHAGFSVGGTERLRLLVNCGVLPWDVVWIDPRTGRLFRGGCTK